VDATAEVLKPGCSGHGNRPNPAGRLKAAWRQSFEVMMVSGPRHSRLNPIRSAIALALLLFAVVPLAAQTNLNLDAVDLSEFEIPLWHAEVQLRGAIGYKDNVTLSSTDPEPSLFWSSGVEALAFRLPSGGWQFSAFLDAVDVRYFDAPDVQCEQQVVLVNEVTRDLGRGWETAAGLNYFFQNQVFDMSATYADTNAIGQVLGHALTPRWRTRKEFKPLWFEVELAATRQLLDAPFDDYWQYGPRLSLGRHLGPRSDLSLTWQWMALHYDTREQVDSAGQSLTNTSLALQTHLVELSWTQAWDERKRWQTTTRAGVELTRDNGSGFYDYHYYRFSQELRFRDASWDARLRARVGYYDYPYQAVSDVDPARRHRTLVGLTLQAERRLARHLRVFASYSWEQSLSNLTYDDYQASVILGGFAVTF